MRTSPRQARARSGRPASSASIVPRTRSGASSRPTWMRTSPQGERSGPLRGTRTPGSPGTDTEANPTARVARSRGVVPAGKRASKIVRRNARARTGRGRATLPSAATARAGVAPPRQETRTRVGRRTGSRLGVRRRPETVWGPGVRHEIHGSGDTGRTHRPTQAVSSLSSNALEAR